MKRTSEYDGLIEDYAGAFNLPVSLVHGIVAVESNYVTHAWRAEPPYQYLWDMVRNRPFRKITPMERKSEQAPKDFPYDKTISSRDSEWWGQQSSWGLMQVMGAVSREHGFKGYFPALCEPEIGLKYGCLHLAHHRDRFYHRHGWEGVVAAYNAGAPRKKNGGWVNQRYVNKVAKADGYKNIKTV